MSTHRVIKKIGGTIVVTDVADTPEDITQRDLDRTAATLESVSQATKKQKRKDVLTEIPSTVNSIPALRIEINKIKQLLSEIIL